MPKKVLNAFLDKNDGAIEFVGEENEYAEAVEQAYGLRPRTRRIFIMGIVLVVVFVIGLFAPTGVLITAANSGGNGYSLAHFFQDVGESARFLLATLTGTETVGTANEGGRITSFFVVALCGAGLALCGALYQGAFRNVLASPTTLGVMNGGQLGLALWVTIFVPQGSLMASFFGKDPTQASAYTSLERFWVNYSSVIFIFLGCIFVVLLVLLVMRASRASFTSPFMLIVVGQVVGAIAAAVVASLRYYFIEVDPDAKGYLMMSLMIASFWRNYSWVDAIGLGIPICGLLAVALLLRRRLGILSLDEAEQRSLGVDGTRMQLFVIVLSTLLNAILIAFCGSVPFVGYIVPLLARRIVGPDFSFLIPASMLLGAIFVLSAYVVLSLIGFATEMTGAIISIFGAGVFIITLFIGGRKNGRFA